MQEATDVLLLMVLENFCQRMSLLLFWVSKDNGALIKQLYHKVVTEKKMTITSIIFY